MNDELARDIDMVLYEYKSPQKMLLNTNLVFHDMPMNNRESQLAFCCGVVFQDLRYTLDAFFLKHYVQSEEFKDECTKETRIKFLQFISGKYDYL